MNRKYIALGTFFVVTIGLLIWLATAVGALGSGRGARYTVRLEHAAGLVQDNAVKIAGVQVGVIESIDVKYKTAVLTLRIDEEVELHQDTLAIVRAKSLLGEKYLQLDPGTQDEPLLEDGAEIERVRKVFEIDQVLNALQPILGGEEGGLGAALGPLAQRIDGLLASAAGQDGQPPIIEREEIEQALDDAVATMAAVRRMAEDNEAGVKELIDNGNKVLGDPSIPRIIRNLDRVSADAANEIPGLLDKADASLTNVKNVTDKLTPQRADQLMAAMDDLTAAAKNLRKITEDLEGVGSDLRPVIADLRTLLARLKSIDELLIRTFLQKEGVKVNLGTNRQAKEKIEDLQGE